MYKIGQLFLVIGEDKQRTVVCLMEINKKTNTYHLKCCEKGSQFNGKRYTVDINIGNQKLKPYSFIVPFKNHDTIEDEERIYLKPKENENTQSL